jgi:hypothetical protein
MCARLSTSPRAGVSRGTCDGDKGGLVYRWRSSTPVRRKSGGGGFRVLQTALSFAVAHNRHRANFHCDEQLATLTRSWEGRNVALQYTRAHVGVTTNEWADIEAKRALDAPNSKRVAAGRPYCAAVLVHPGVRGAFTAGSVRTRTWAVARLADEVQKWLRESSLRTVLAGEGDMVTTKIPTASADGILLQTFASRRVFACDAGQFHSAGVARAHRETRCECGAPRRTWEHYAGNCQLVSEQRRSLAAKKSAARLAFEGDPMQYVWGGALRVVQGGKASNRLAD